MSGDQGRVIDIDALIQSRASPCNAFSLEQINSAPAAVSRAAFSMDWSFMAHFLSGDWQLCIVAALVVVLRAMLSVNLTALFVSNY